MVKWLLLGVSLIPGPWVSLRVMVNSETAFEASSWLHVCGGEYWLSIFLRKKRRSRVYIVTCLHVFVFQVEFPDVLRRSDSRVTLHRLTSSRHLPFLISDKPHLLSTSWRSTEWFSSWFCFLCYLRDFFFLPLPTSSTSSAKQRGEPQIKKTPVTLHYP